MTNRQTTTRLLTMTAIFAALIYLFTAYLHIPSHNGYTHIGDGLIYLAASLLPPGYAVAASAIGAALADGLSGYAIWIVPSILIKTATALCFTAKAVRILCTRNYVALFASLLLCAGGYYLAECVMVGNFIAPLLGIPGYCIQVALSSLFYLALAKTFDRMQFKKRYFTF